MSCSIGDAVGINRHFKEKNTDSHFYIYLGGTRRTNTGSMGVAETVQHSDSSKSTDYNNVIHNKPAIINSTTIPQLRQALQSTPTSGRRGATLSA